jgi:hypothetical protein
MPVFDFEIKKSIHEEQEILSNLIMKYFADNDTRNVYEKHLHRIEEHELKLDYYKKQLKLLKENKND